MIDTHIHIDGEEFRADLAEVIQRAKDAGAECLFVPGINLDSLKTIPEVCAQYPGFLRPMYGLHPEDVNANWQEALAQIKPFIYQRPAPALSMAEPQPNPPAPVPNPQRPVLGHTMPEPNPAAPIAIGEVGLDFYWSREFEQEQLLAFEEQVRWSIETRLPLMIHCRKAQNEMVKILRKYQAELPGGVFHCFTGNPHEAEELLNFQNFVLGIGGVLTFKKSNLPETLRAAVPLERIVLETDAPYMAPVPMRGQRNESSYIPFIMQKLAEVYAVSTAEISETTTKTVKKLFKI